MSGVSDDQRTRYSGCLLVPLSRRRLFIRLREISNAFRDIGRQVGVQFPDDVRLIAINPSGLMIDAATQRTMPLGHFDLHPPLAAGSSQTRLLIPFVDKCCDLTPLSPSALFELARARHEKERAYLAAMLEAVGVDPAGSPAICLLTKAHVGFNSVFHDDTDRLALTQSLSPTASMPGAVYAPECIFERADIAVSLDHRARADEWSYMWPYSLSPPAGSA